MQRAYQSTTHLIHERPTPVSLRIEPWGEEYAMPPGTLFRIIAYADEPGALEITAAEDYVAVWAWSGAVLAVYEGEQLVGPPPESRTTSP